MKHKEGLVPVVVQEKICSELLRSVEIFPVEDSIELLKELGSNYIQFAPVDRVTLTNKVEHLNFIISELQKFKLNIDLLPGEGVAQN